MHHHIGDKPPECRVLHELLVELRVIPQQRADDAHEGGVQFDVGCVGGVLFRVLIGLICRDLGCDVIDDTADNPVAIGEQDAELLVEAR